MLLSRGFARKIIVIITQMFHCDIRQCYPDETDLENVDAGHNSNQVYTTRPTPSSYTQDIPKSLTKAIEDYIRFSKVTFTSESFEVFIRNIVQNWKDGAYVCICALSTWRLDANELTG